MTRDGPTDYPVDGRDDDDSSGDVADDEDEEEAFEEEEEHLAPVDSTLVSPTVDPVPSPKETEPFETDESAATPPPPPVYRTTARMSVRSWVPISFPSEAEVARLLAIPIPSPSLLTLLSSPLPQIPSPYSYISPTYVEAPLGYRVVGIRLRAASPLPLPSPSLPPPSSPLLLPFTDHRADIPEAVADYGFIGTLDAVLRRDHVREMGYKINDVWEDLSEATEEVPPTTMAELSQRMTNLVTTVRQDMDEIYVQFVDAQDIQALLRGQTTSLQTQLIAALGRIDTLEARELAHTNGPEDADSFS
ncbi:hypothetical protein Tco_0789421 [Tanacetum coccineum]